MAHLRQQMTLQQVNEAAEDNLYWSYIDLVDATMSALCAIRLPDAAADDLEATADIVADLASSIQSGPPGAITVKQAPFCKMHTERMS